MFRHIESKLGLVLGAGSYTIMFSLYGMTMLKLWIFREVDIPLQIACSVFMVLFVLPDLSADVYSYVGKRRAMKVKFKKELDTEPVEL